MDILHRIYKEMESFKLHTGMEAKRVYLGHEEREQLGNITHSLCIARAAGDAATPRIFGMRLFFVNESRHLGIGI